MALSDLVTKAKVNLALARDSRVTSLDIGVSADDSVVTLTGDVDSEVERQAAEQIARTVDGVRGIRNEITVGLGQTEDTSELISQRLLDKLEDEWNSLPDDHALTQADYLRWALWLIHKYRIPSVVSASDTANSQAEALDRALDQIAGYAGVSKALMALEMLRLAEEVETHHEGAPQIEYAPLVSTPIAAGDADRAAA